jgi:hypothetical protein
MAIALGIRERQKNHLLSLLVIKASNPDIVVKGLQDEITCAIARNCSYGPRRHCMSRKIG